MGDNMFYVYYDSIRNIHYLQKICTKGILIIGPVTRACNNYKPVTDSL